MIFDFTLKERGIYSLYYTLGFNGAETNCGVAHILGILLMNSYEIKICSEVCPL